MFNKKNQYKKGKEKKKISIPILQEGALVDEPIEQLIKKFAEKNKSFIRTIVENHFVRGQIEASEGKITRIKLVDLNSKDTT